VSGTIRASLAAWVMVVVSASPAAAQLPSGRFTISFGAGVQAAMPGFDERFTFLRPVDQAENATADVRYEGKAALLIDGGFAVRLIKNVGVGVSISRYQGDSHADVTAQIPHPFEFNKPRDVSGTATGLDHTELGYHVQLQFSRMIGHRLRLVLTGGPTVFDVKRQIVDTVEVDESYPFDTATFRSARTSAANGTGIGFNAGVDLVWTINRNAGLGALVRYARGTADLDVAARTASVDVGGVQATGGLRLYF
jgi:hypothetical protein